jgi:hypothetical protein
VKNDETTMFTDDDIKDKEAESQKGLAMYDPKNLGG